MAPPSILPLITKESEVRPFPLPLVTPKGRGSLLSPVLFGDLWPHKRVYNGLQIAIQAARIPAINSTVDKMPAFTSSPGSKQCHRQFDSTFLDNACMKVIGLTADVGRCSHRPEIEQPNETDNTCPRSDVRVRDLDNIPLMNSAEGRQVLHATECECNREQPFL